MTFEILYFDERPHHAALAPRLREIAAAAGIEVGLELRLVADPADAERERFLGSPTVRLDGQDVEPGADRRTDFGIKCRLRAPRTAVVTAPTSPLVGVSIASPPLVGSLSLDPPIPGGCAGGVGRVRDDRAR